MFSDLQSGKKRGVAGTSDFLGRTVGGLTQS